jgi:hypothetical protein
MQSRLFRALVALLILFPVAAYATNPAYVTSSLSVSSPTNPITPAAGDDLILVVVGLGSAGTLSSVTDSTGASVITDFAYPTNAEGYGVYRVQGATNVSQTFTVNWTTAPTRYYLLVYEVSNVAGVDTGAGTISESSGTSASWTSEAVTPAASGDFMIAAFGADTSSLTSLAFSNGYTEEEQGTGGPSYIEGYLANAAAGSQTSDATASASVNYTGIVIPYVGTSTPTATVVAQAEASSATGQTSLASTQLNVQAGDDLFVTVASGSPTTPVLLDSAGDAPLFDGAVEPQTGLYEYAFEVMGGTANSATVFTANGTSIYGIAALQVRGLVTNKPIFTFGTPPSHLAWNGTYVARAPFAENAQTAPGASTDAITSTTNAPGVQPAMVIGFSAIPGENGAAVNAAPSAGTGFTAQTGVWETWGGGAGDYLGVFETEQVTSTSAVAATFTAPTYGSGAYGTFAWIVPELP